MASKFQWMVGNLAWINKIDRTNRDRDSSRLVTDEERLHGLSAVVTSVYQNSDNTKMYFEFKTESNESDEKNRISDCYIVNVEHEQLNERLFLALEEHSLGKHFLRVENLHARLDIGTECELKILTDGETRFRNVRVVVDTWDSTGAMTFSIPDGEFLETNQSNLMIRASPNCQMLQFDGIKRGNSYHQFRNWIFSVPIKFLDVGTKWRCYICESLNESSIVECNFCRSNRL